MHRRYAHPRELNTNEQYELVPGYLCSAANLSIYINSLFDLPAMGNIDNMHPKWVPCW